MIGGTLIVAGMMKLLEDPSARVGTIAGDWLDTSDKAVALGVAEILLGVWVGMGRKAVTSLSIALLGFSFFAGVLWVSYATGDARPCGCFGASTVGTAGPDSRDALLASAGRATLLALASGALLHAASVSLRSQRDVSPQLEANHS
jgi:hypothetical protein